MNEEPTSKLKSMSRKALSIVLKKDALLALIAATLWAYAALAFFIDNLRHVGWALALGGLAFVSMGLLILTNKKTEESSERSQLKEVLDAEDEQIKKARNPNGTQSGEDTGMPQPRVGLALSGGGIRSATFNLGLIQALADLHLLSRIDYLSTVSGGGYIGSWLMRWVRRAQPDPLAVTPADLKSDDEAIALAAMLYVAWADSRLSGADRAVLDRSFEPAAGGGVRYVENKPSAAEREKWLAVVADANLPLERSGAARSQHRKAGFAAKARRIVSQHRQAIEEHSSKTVTWAERDEHRAMLRALEQGLEEKERALSEIESTLKLRGIDKIEHFLADEASVGSPEPRPIAHLRDFSNYLTPRVGLLTADTWTTVATYIRNFALNLVMITATVSIVLLMPRLIRGLVWQADGLVARLVDSPSLAVRLMALHWDLAAAILLSFFAVLVICESLRRAALELDRGQQWWTSQLHVQALVVWPFGAASLLASHWLGSAPGNGLGWEHWAAVTAAAYALPWLLFGWATGLRLATRSEANERWTLANSVLALAGIAVGAAGGALAFKLRALLPALDGWALMTLGPPIIMSTFTLSAVLLIGLAGRRLDDYLREWLARVGAWVTIYSLAWLILVGLANYGPVLLAAATVQGRALLASGWLAASIGGVFAGNAQQQGAEKKWHGPVVKVAPWIFILGLVLLLTWGLDAGLSRQNETLENKWKSFVQTARAGRSTETLQYRSDGTKLRVERSKELSGGWLKKLNTMHVELLDLQLGLPLETGEANAKGQEERDPWIVLLFWLGGISAIGALLSWRVDINEFSMHNYYRNRLVRAYLGASNPNRDRKTQPFTGMARSDDSPLGTGECLRPYHLINTTLNLVGGDRLAWQQRKAAAYLLSPLFSGFELPPSEESLGREAAFRQTRDLSDLTLGTAFAISGAAASPNMGFRSSSALTILLTVFNVRLGWWLGNPRYKTSNRLTPRFSLKPLLFELFGMTSLDRDYIYLSDGGHFENLGIYELVRRRCRFIIATDLGADPDLAFSDLGNAIRKCRSDFGAQIDIDVGPLEPDPTSGMSSSHCVVGKITYAPDMPGDLPDRGWLLYIKSSLTGDEPEDVLQYKQANEAFPHQGTIDQFFDESQFESYRRLGRHVGHRVFESASAELEEKFTNWYSLFEDLRQRWYAPSAAVEQSFSKHGQALNRLFARIRADPWLKFLDNQIYRELDGDNNLAPATEDLPTDPVELRAGFYFCGSLIQLMENVYLDLNFDDEYQHPDNRGWFHLFMRWAAVPMMRATWAVTAGTFGARFQSFCERRLKLTHGSIEPTQATAKDTIDVLVARLPRKIRTQNSGLKNDQTISWYQLKARANGLSFNIGYAATRRRSQTSGPDLVYFEVDEHLRQSGLAKRALRELKAHIGDPALKLVPKNERLSGIEAKRWLAFQHFYNGAVNDRNS